MANVSERKNENVEGRRRKTQRRNNVKFLYAKKKRELFIVFVGGVQFQCIKPCPFTTRFLVFVFALKFFHHHSPEMLKIIKNGRCFAFNILTFSQRVKNFEIFQLYTDEFLVGIGTLDTHRFIT